MSLCIPFGRSTLDVQLPCGYVPSYMFQSGLCVFSLLVGGIGSGCLFVPVCVCV